MGLSNRGNRTRMARSAEPPFDRSANFAPRNRRLALGRVSRDEQHEPITCRNRPLKALIDGIPRIVEAMAVKIDHAVRTDFSRRQPSIPAAIERGVEMTA